jgi:hypothetical protein
MAGSPVQAFMELNGYLTFIFALWLLPLFAVLWFYGGYEKVSQVVTGADLQEPFANFTFIFLALSRRLRTFFVNLINRLSGVFGGSALAWWLCCLMVGVLLDGLISEAAVMVLVCSALIERFYSKKPSAFFCYLTLAVVLHILALGNLTLPYNITASMDLSTTWGWTHFTILNTLSLRVLCVVLIVLFGGALLLRSELAAMNEPEAPQAEPLFSVPVIAYLAAFLVAGTLEALPFVLIALVAFICVLEHGKEQASHAERLNLPILIALFNYSMELHAHFLSVSVESLYTTVGGEGAEFATLLLSALNAHIPGQAFVNTFALQPEAVQATALLAVALGSGLTMFAAAVNVLGSKLLREHFPDRLVSGPQLLKYSLPLTGLSYALLKASYLILP